MNRTILIFAAIAVVATGCENLNSLTELKSSQIQMKPAGTSTKLAVNANARPASRIAQTMKSEPLPTTGMVQVWFKDGNCENIAVSDLTEADVTYNGFRWEAAEGFADKWAKIKLDREHAAAQEKDRRAQREAEEAARVTRMEMEATPAKRNSQPTSGEVDVWFGYEVVKMDAATLKEGEIVYSESRMRWHASQELCAKRQERLEAERAAAAAAREAEEAERVRNRLRQDLQGLRDGVAGLNEELPKHSVELAFLIDECEKLVCENYFDTERKQFGTKLKQVVDNIAECHFDNEVCTMSLEYTNNIFHVKYLEKELPENFGVVSAEGKNSIADGIRNARSHIADIRGKFSSPSSPGEALNLLKDAAAFEKERREVYAQIEADNKRAAELMALPEEERFAKSDKPFSRVALFKDLKSGYSQDYVCAWKRTNKHALEEEGIEISDNYVDDGLSSLYVRFNDGIMAEDIVERCKKQFGDQVKVVFTRNDPHLDTSSSSYGPNMAFYKMYCTQTIEAGPIIVKAQFKNFGGLVAVDEKRINRASRFGTAEEKMKLVELSAESRGDFVMDADGKVLRETKYGKEMFRPYISVTKLKTNDNFASGYSVTDTAVAK